MRFIIIVLAAVTASARPLDLFRGGGNVPLNGVATLSISNLEEDENRASAMTSDYFGGEPTVQRTRCGV